MLSPVLASGQHVRWPSACSMHALLIAPALLHLANSENWQPWLTFCSRTGFGQVIADDGNPFTDGFHL